MWHDTYTVSVGRNSKSIDCNMIGMVGSQQYPVSRCVFPPATSWLWRFLHCRDHEAVVISSVLSHSRGLVMALCLDASLCSNGVPRAKVLAHSATTACARCAVPVRRCQAHGQRQCYICLCCCSDCTRPVPRLKAYIPRILSSVQSLLLQLLLLRCTCSRFKCDLSSPSLKTCSRAPSCHTLANSSFCTKFVRAVEVTLTKTTQVCRQEHGAQRSWRRTHTMKNTTSTARVDHRSITPCLPGIGTSLQKKGTLANEDLPRWTNKTTAKVWSQILEDHDVRTMCGRARIY